MNKTKVAKLEHSKVKVRAHHPALCAGKVCCLHNRSNHHMRKFYQHWRDDTGVMERICDHGIGHPDVDSPLQDQVHGCDGCCKPPGEVLP